IAEFLLAKHMNKRIVGVIVDPIPLQNLPTEMTAEWQLVDLTAGKRSRKATVTLPPDDKPATVAFADNGLERLRIGLMQAGLDVRYFLRGLQRAIPIVHPIAAFNRLRARMLASSSAAMLRRSSGSTYCAGSEMLPHPGWWRSSAHPSQRSRPSCVPCYFQDSPATASMLSR